MSVPRVGTRIVGHLVKGQRPRNLEALKTAAFQALEKINLDAKEILLR